MRRLLSSPLLLVAWLLVLGGVAAAVTYSLNLPVPPPSGEAVSLAMPVYEPPPDDPTAEEDSGPNTFADLPPAETVESAAAPTEADQPMPSETAPEERATAAETAVVNAATDEAATEVPAAGAAPPEAPNEPETPEAVDSEAPEPETAVAIAVPLPKPAPPEGPLQSEPETVTAPLPANETESTVEAPSPPKTEGTAETVTAASPSDEQVVRVPIIPPAPEDLPYWERYRQPFNTADTRPRIAVVLTGLGLSDSATRAAIDNLPGAITLSFSPYARDLERWIALARARGHEVMLDLPMEPTTFPNEDPGPQALLTNLSAEDNLDRLDWVLSRGSAYVGVAGNMGSRFTASRQQMDSILRELKSRGLIFLDNRTTEKSVAPIIAAEIGLHSAFNNRSIDERQASRLAIDARLAQIERIALSEGFAVAMAQPYPVTLDRLVEWSTEIGARGYVIAPISALVDRQRSR